MPRRRTQQAVAEAAPLEAARAAAGASAQSHAKGRSGATGGVAGPGSTDPLAAELRRAGLLPLLVLHFLAAGPSYGNQLMEHVETLSCGLIAVNPNTMYPLLRRLEGEGLIAGEWEHPERRSRRFYRLTESGEVERERLRAAVGPRLDAARSVLRDIQRELGA